MTGADLVCSTLERLGIRCVFGMPGTQSLPLYNALRTSKLRTVTATHELAAAFMANGYFRASGKPAALLTIPGPGLTYALTGLAEAQHDSAAMIHLMPRKKNGNDRSFAFQAIDQESILTPFVKKSFSIFNSGDIVTILTEGLTTAICGQPGPVAVELDIDMLFQSTGVSAPVPITCAASAEVSDRDLHVIRDRLLNSKRPVLFFGQGAQEGSAAATQLAEQLHCPVLTTSAGRGVMREDHPLVVGPGFTVYGLELVNELLESSDLIVAVGCKLSHNGSGGFKLKLPEAKLIHVDAAPEVLNANYPASLAVCADAPQLLARLADELSQARAVSVWTEKDIADIRHRLLAEIRLPRPHYPRAVDCRPAEISHVFEALRRALPRDCTVVTDSGLHQYLTRCFFEVQTPRGLVTPSDFQSMGYGIPAAIGAKLARPDRPTVVITGDGGFAMTGMELLTMVKEKAPLAVIVFNDNALALIRDQQSDMFGDNFGVGLKSPDFEAFAVSMGVEYFPAEGNPEEQFRRAISSSSGAIVEVRLNQSVSRRTTLAVGRLRRRIRRSIGSWLPFKS